MQRRLPRLRDCHRRVRPQPGDRKPHHPTATGTETYATFAGDTETPEAGEVIFADDAGHAHARRWTNRQSCRSAIRPETHVVLIVSEAMDDTGQHDSALREELREALTLCLDRDDLTPTTRQSMAPCRSSPIRRRTILMPASGVSPQPADGPRRHPHPVTWPPRCTASTALTGCGTDAAASPRVTARNSRPTNGHIRTTAYRLVNDQKEPPCRI